MLIGQQKRFFHWFLEFPKVMERGGFDCILGNPPYLGDKALSGTYGYAFCEYVRWQYAPTGLSDLVVFFLRRIYELLRDNGFLAIITTNSIIDGKNQKDGLEQIISDGGQINMAVHGIKWPGVANLVVSLFAVHRGEWGGPRMLDHQPAKMINVFFEEDKNLAAPKVFQKNCDQMFCGSHFLGDGFLLSHTEADQLRASDPRNAEVIMPIINGNELNNHPEQLPGRSIINFRDWPIERAQEYVEPFSIVEEKVKPFRAKQNRKRNREVWWIYAEHRPGLTRAIQNLPQCFAAAGTTKHFCFSAMPTDYVFTHALFIFTTERWDLFSVVQSTLHEVWARKYSGSLGRTLRYSPSKCFNTFPFPTGLWKTLDVNLTEIGERYHAHRKKIMQSLWLGLTKVYNLFHNPDLSVEMVEMEAQKGMAVAVAGFEPLIELRSLHVELDTAVRDAYGWQDLDLDHDFYEVETLPEDDRMRYTISPSARREILNRLLIENHARTELQGKKFSAKSNRRKRKNKSTTDLPNFF